MQHIFKQTKTFIDYPGHFWLIRTRLKTSQNTLILVRTFLDYPKYFQTI